MYNLWAIVARTKKKKHKKIMKTTEQTKKPIRKKKSDSIQNTASNQRHEHKTLAAKWHLVVWMNDVKKPRKILKANKIYKLNMRTQCISGVYVWVCMWIAMENLFALSMVNTFGTALPFSHLHSPTHHSFFFVSQFLSLSAWFCIKLALILVIQVTFSFAN